MSGELEEKGEFPGDGRSVLHRQTKLLKVGESAPGVVVHIQPYDLDVAEVMPFEQLLRLAKQSCLSGALASEHCPDLLGQDCLGDGSDDEVVD